jgi:hypothetical protein
MEAVKERAMLESQIDQAERRRVLENERKLREQQQGSTYHAHAQADLEIPGRFSALGKAHVVGTGAPEYPAASHPWQGPDPVPNEPALGYSIDKVQRD